MKKEYQIEERKARRRLSIGGLELLSEFIREALSGVYQSVEALAGEIGIRVMLAYMSAEVNSLVGPRYARNPERRAYRWASQGGYVIFAGRKVPIKRVRVRGIDGKEISLENYLLFQQDGKMQRAVLGKLLLGVSQRNYERALEEFCEGYGVKKSSIGRHWIKATEEELKALLERPLGELGLCAIIIDGIEFKECLLVVALGVSRDGEKYILGLWPGATENATICRELLEDMVRRGLDPDGHYLFVLDGSKALRKAVAQVFGERTPVQRCQLHKRRNVKDHLPVSLQAEADRRLKAAYGMASYHEAKRSLEETVRWLEGKSPSAARSLEEGMEETLILHKLGVPEVLRKSLSSTNLIESPFATTRHLTRNVKRWRNEGQVQRWVATMLIEAEKRFRKVRGYRALPVLLSALDQLDEQAKVG